MNICVFCGSAAGRNPVYGRAAENFGRLLAEGRHRLVYGGGNVGLMGIVADAVLKHEGEVIGVIPGFLEQREVAHRGVTKLEVVTSMHQRKQRMAELAEAFVALPGGWGTLEELAEILTWKQLGLIRHQVGLLNINGFFDPLLLQLQRMVDEGFLAGQNFKSLHVHSDEASMLRSLAG